MILTSHPVSSYGTAVGFLPSLVWCQVVWVVVQLVCHIPPEQVCSGDRWCQAVIASPGCLRDVLNQWHVVVMSQGRKRNEILQREWNVLIVIQPPRHFSYRFIKENLSESFLLTCTLLQCMYGNGVKKESERVPLTKLCVKHLGVCITIKYSIPSARFCSFFFILLWCTPPFFLRSCHKTNCFLL